MARLASRHKHTKHKLGLVISSTLILSITLSAIILPLTKTASALKADSISEVQGSTKGGEEVIIKGEGFLEEEDDEIKKIFSLGPCSIGKGVGEPAQIYLEVGSKLILTERGIFYEYKANGDIINITKTNNLGRVVESGDSYAILDGKSFINIVYDACGGVNSIRIGIGSPPPEYVDINGSIEKLYCDIYNGSCVSESGYYVDMTGEYDPEFTIPLNEGEKVTGWSNLNGAITNLGRVLYQGEYDITGLLGDSYIISEKNEWGTSTRELILSSGDKIVISNSTGEIEGVVRLPGLEVGETIKGFYHNYVLTNSGKIFIEDESGVYKEALEIPPVEWVDAHYGSLYLKDGTIYGRVSYDGDIEKDPGLNGEKLVSKATFFTYGGSVKITESGKVYAHNGYSSQDDILIYTLDEDEEVLINSDSRIYTTKNRLLELEGGYSSSTSEFEVQVTETDMTGILPKAQIPQVARILFGSAEVTDFEILDNNTIRARVPANARGTYGISIQSISSNTPILTSLNYEYINGDNSEGSQNNGSGNSSTIISAPNTGFKRN